ncbi:MAG TPA: ferredoxin [Trebonia sp.]|nr:ferredoxin [Trebonia sp.]
MRVHADRDSCVSSGQCVRTVPDVFDQDEDEGVVFLKTSAPPPELAGEVRRAAAMCPAMAITLTEG